MPEITLPYPNFLADTYIMPDEVNADFAALANQALNRYGGTIAGNITVAPGITIDGVDLSNLAPTGPGFPTFTRLTLTDALPNTLWCPNGGVQCVGLDAGLGDIKGKAVIATGAVTATGDITSGGKVQGTVMAVAPVAPANPLVAMIDPNVAANAKRTHISASADQYHVYAATDAGAFQRTLFKVNRSTANMQVGGSIQERGGVAPSTTPMGYWTIVPYNADDYTCVGGGATWTVLANQVFYRYAVIGRTLLITLYLNDTVLSGPGVGEVNVKLPAGLNVLETVQAFHSNKQGGGSAEWQVGLTLIHAGNPNLRFWRNPSGQDFFQAGDLDLSTQMFVPF